MSWKNMLTDSPPNTTTILSHDTSCIISVPHGGLSVPSSLKDHYAITRELLLDTDLYTDKLYAFSFGTSITFALNPFVVNVNRFRTPELTGSHLGEDPLHHKTLTGKLLLKQEHTKEDVAWLLAQYDAFHNAIAAAITQMKREHGYALLIDCHSCNSVGLVNAAGAGKQRADFIVGTRGGSSAHPEIVEAFVNALKKSGHSVAIDDPFSGGAITQLYANPKNNVHVLQLETRKGLYMDESLEEGNFTLYQERLESIRDVIAKAVDASSIAINLLQSSNKYK